MLAEFRSWGINRFSISWLSQSLSGTNPREVSDKLALRGYAINLHKVPDLEAFLHAVLMTPRSVRADYNFPNRTFMAVDLEKTATVSNSE